MGGRWSHTWSVNGDWDNRERVVSGVGGGAAIGGRERLDLSSPTNSSSLANSSISFTTVYTTVFSEELEGAPGQISRLLLALLRQESICV
ncbi:hypothetical protein L1987_01807 [Smallanthus sonchifolius]|uniref:Uncharacterized protein n=1 Tax=Smallanthus sonchifolius TaxID=185202 RepID=A0ACB9K641_9ASTR|nr:hypothetical protein L1987_01807 [Smallanthus sonchifolius]